jgi:hypothetical protein
VRFVPLLPPHWPQAQVVLQRGGHAHVIDIVRAGSAEVPGSRSLAVGAWLDLDALHAPSRWTLTMTDRPGPLAAPGSAAWQGLERTSV